MGGLASGREAVIRNKIVSLTHIWNLKKKRKNGYEEPRARMGIKTQTY